MDLYKAISIRLKNLLTQNNITVKELAQKTNISKQRIINLINEKQKRTKLSTILIIAKGFNLSLPEFFKDDIFNFKNLDIN